MRKQYAVLGLGSFGYSVAVTLQNLGCEVVAVDNHIERVEAISNSVSYAMKADIGDPDVIRALGVRNLDGVIVAVAEDMEASVMATLVSKEIGVPYVLAKVKNEHHGTILRKIGADAVTFPEYEMGTRVARNLVSAEFADWIALSSEYSIIEIAPPAAWVGKSLKELDVRRSYDVNVVGIKEGEHVEVNVDAEKQLTETMILILAGSNEALDKLKKGRA